MSASIPTWVRLLLFNHLLTQGDLGSHGWMILAVSLVTVGRGVLWYLPEKMLSKYRAVD